MKILLINQTFWPDVAATAQYLTDLAKGLKAAGHEVSVLTSCRSYVNTELSYPTREYWNDIRIIRIGGSAFGRKTKLARVVDFGSFWLNATLRIFALGSYDCVVGLTSPPLIGLLGSMFVKARGGKFIYWVMDVNPDEALAAEWMRPGLLSRFLEWCSVRTFEASDYIVALDEFMKNRIASKGISEDKIRVIPPWSHDDVIRFDNEGRARFRAEHDISGKFVIMYSGNHSPCHPLNTLMNTALELREEKHIHFLFVGGGNEFLNVQQFKMKYSLDNITCLPYQPLEKLAASLSAADLHVVIMGDPFVGMIHPCKIYNILSVNSPVLYIGPTRSHISDILDRIDDKRCIISVRHNDAIQTTSGIRMLASSNPRRMEVPVAREFSMQQVLRKFIALLEEVNAETVSCSAPLTDQI